MFKASNAKIEKQEADRNQGLFCLLNRAMEKFWEGEIIFYYVTSVEKYNQQSALIIRKNLPARILNMLR